MKDLLPDLVHDRLPPAARNEVREHIETCEDCRMELDVLIRVRAAVIAPSVNVTRIASELRPHVAIASWRRAAQSPYLRIAAAIVLLIGIATIGSDSRIDPSDSLRVSEQVTDVAVTELAVGEALVDLSDADLQLLLEEIGQIEALTSPEPEVVVPALSRGGA